jgi:hypothetical protein
MGEMAKTHILSDVSKKYKISQDRISTILLYVHPDY